MSLPFMGPPPQDGPVVPYGLLLEQAQDALPDSLPDKPEEILLALDVDGTILRLGEPSPKMLETYLQAREAGFNVVIATGRGLGGTRNVFSQLQAPTGLSVTANGAQTLLWDNQGNRPEVTQKLSEHLFRPGPVAEQIAQAMPGAVFGIDGEDGAMLVTKLFTEGELLTHQEEISLAELFDSETTRMIVRAEKLPKEQFREILGSLDLSSVEYSVGWTSWGDVTGPGVTKATGLEDLAQTLGVPRHGTIALGDGMNDIEMLSWANHGVAMGGSPQEVVAVADTVAGSVDHDGAAAVLEALLQRY